MFRRFSHSRCLFAASAFASGPLLAAFEVRLVEPGGAAAAALLGLGRRANR